MASLNSTPIRLLMDKEVFGVPFPDVMVYCKEQFGYYPEIVDWKDTYGLDHWFGFKLNPEDTILFIFKYGSNKVKFPYHVMDRT